MGDVYVKISASNSGSKYQNIPKLLSKSMLIKLSNVNIDVDTPFSEINQHLYNALNVKLEPASSEKEDDSLYSNAYRELISSKKVTDIFSIDSISFEDTGISDRKVQDLDESIFIVITREDPNDKYRPTIPGTPEYTPQSEKEERNERHEEAQLKWIAHTSRNANKFALFKLKFK